MNMHLVKQLKYVGLGFLVWLGIVLINLAVDQLLSDDSVRQAVGFVLFATCFYFLGRGLSNLLEKK